MSDDDQKELSELDDVSTWRRGQPTVSLYYTALHELGHAMGLDHSIYPDDVMSPWYNPKQTRLSANDRRRLREVACLGGKAPGGEEFKPDLVANTGPNEPIINFQAQSGVDGNSLVVNQGQQKGHNLSFDSGETFVV